MLTAQDGLTGNSIRAIVEDTNGGLWIGTGNQGLDLYQNGKTTGYRAGTNSLPGNDISCLTMDSAGTLWVGTFAHGLAGWGAGKWDSFSTRRRPCQR